MIHRRAWSTAGARALPFLPLIFREEMSLSALGKAK